MICSPRGITLVVAGLVMLPAAGCVEGENGTVGLEMISVAAAERLSEPDFFGSIDQIGVRSDGMIAVWDRLTGAVGVLDPSEPGSTQQLPRGQGPGEVRLAVGVGWMKDGRLAVADPGNARVSFFDVSGSGIVSVGAVAHAYRPVGMCAGPSGVVTTAPSGERMMRRWDEDLAVADSALPFPVEAGILRELVAYGSMVCLDDGGVVQASYTLPWVSEWRPGAGERQWAIPGFDPTQYEISEDGRGFAPDDGPDGSSDVVKSLAVRDEEIWLSISSTRGPEVTVRKFVDTRLVAEYRGERSMRLLGFLGDDWIVVMDTPGPELFRLPSPVVAR